MAITSATVTYQDSGGDDEIVEVWKIVAATTDSIPAMLDDVSMPAIGDSHTDDGQYKLVRPRQLKRADGADNNGIWDATLTWRKRSGGSRTPVSETTDRLLSFEIITATYQVVAEKGYLYDSVAGWGGAKVAVKNSAGDSYDPALTVILHNPVFRFTETEDSTFDANAALDLIGTINSAAINVCGTPIAAETAILRDISPKYVGDNEWECSYEIEIEKEYPICPEVLDAGYNYLHGGTDYREIRLSDLNLDYAPGGAYADKDKPVSDPQELDGSGGLNTGAPVFRKYRFGELNAWATTLDLVAAL